MTRPRPLSPHLQVYRLPLAALISITHRFTGIALSAGLFVLTAWLFTVAFGTASCVEWFQEILSSPIGLICMAGWIFALYFHSCSGVRHLIWDIGIGFSKEAYGFSNFLVMGAALAMTICTVCMLAPRYSSVFGVTL